MNCVRITELTENWGFLFTEKWGKIVTENMGVLLVENEGETYETKEKTD